MLDWQDWFQRMKRFTLNKTDLPHNKDSVWAEDMYQAFKHRLMQDPELPQEKNDD